MILLKNLIIDLNFIQSSIKTICIKLENNRGKLLYILTKFQIGTMVFYLIKLITSILYRTVNILCFLFLIYYIFVIRNRIQDLGNLMYCYCMTYRVSLCVLSLYVEFRHHRSEFIAFPRFLPTREPTSKNYVCSGLHHTQVTQITIVLDFIYFCTTAFIFLLSAKVFQQYIRYTLYYYTTINIYLLLNCFT